MGEFPYHKTDDVVSILIDFQPYLVDKSNPNFDRIMAAIDDPNTTSAEMIALTKPVNAVIDATAHVPEIEIRDGVVFFDGVVVHNALTQRMLNVMSTPGLSIDRWVEFAKNLMSNPRQSSRDDLFEWISKCDMPLTVDGCFLAYKIVNDDYKDIYTGTMDNSVGQTVVMPGGREAVDPDRENVCSRGLHFCSKGYLGSYGTGPGNHVMLVKVNPADVVSIPIDYNHAKGRTWRYEVVGEISMEDAGMVEWPAWTASYDDYEWDEPGDDDFDDEEFDDIEDEIDDPKPPWYGGAFKK